MYIVEPLVLKCALVYRVQGQVVVYLLSFDIQLNAVLLLFIILHELYLTGRAVNADWDIYFFLYSPVPVTTHA